MLPEFFAPFHLIILATVTAVLFVIPFWQIFKKAGMPGALSLLIVVPIIGTVLLYVLAFSRWKTQPEKV
jgi:Zn-dependent protease with chaperone function